MAFPRPHLLFVPALLAATFACSSPPAQPTTPVAETPPTPAPTTPGAPASAPAHAAPSADRDFEAFAQRFLDEYFRRTPDEATQAGEHRYDATWPDVSVQGEAARWKTRSST